jgi:RimJ/RimL family protein N-acetyltransferase
MGFDIRAHGPDHRLMTHAFSFQPLTEDDLPLLCEWLNRPHLQEWWREGDTSLEAVREKYLPRITGDDVARPFLALLDGTPAGYIQYYDAAAGNPDWWPDTPQPGVLGIDQFLADADRLGQGLGTAMVSQFTALLFQDPAVTEIRVDPNPANRRAIECYRKAGFREAGPITTPDGPAKMMVLRRKNLPNSQESQKTV